jgi:hypothetical protein
MRSATPMGVLHVSGSDWKSCRRIRVDLPEPWAGSESSVGGDGRFSLVNAHPMVKPYEGTVTVTCAEPPREAQARAEIRVGDRRNSQAD